MHPTEEVKDQLDKKIEKWLQFDLQYHDEFVNSLDEVEAYLNSAQTPSGFKLEGKDSFAERNDPTVIPDHRYYVVVNQVIQAHERLLGNFSKARQTVTLSGRGMKDPRKVSMLHKGNKYIEDHNRTFHTVYFPAIDSFLSGGLGGARLVYDPYDAPPNGWIREEYVDPADLILDANSKHPFFLDANRRTVRMIMDKENARVEFTGIDGFDPESLKVDAEWSRSMTKRGLDPGMEPVTVYFMEYRVREQYYLKHEGDEFSEINEDEYAAALSEGKEDVLPNKQWVYYQLYYNPGYGVFWHQKSPYNCFTIHLCIGRKTRNHPYPVSDFVAYKNIQDLFNVLVTASLDDAREGRKWGVAMDPAMYANYGQQVMDQLEKGFAVIPSNVAHAITGPGLSQGILWLLEFVKRAIDDINALPSVSRGELPAKQISSETVNVLQAAAAVSHGRKDIMISDFITSVTKARIKMMMTHWDGEDWMRLVDAEPGSPEYVPINMTLVGEDAYLEFLAKTYGIQVPEGEIPPEVAQALMQARAMFEMENSVEVEQREQRRYSDGTTVENDQYEQEIVSSGMTPADFVEANQVERVTTPIFKINHIDPTLDLDVKCTVDFDIDNTKQRKQSLAYELGARGWYHPVDVMRDLEIEDAERKYDRATRENELRQLAERIGSDPQFQQALQIGQQIMSNPTLRKKFQEVASQGGGEGAA